MGNKVTYGLKNVHYATFTNTDGVITYDTPVKIPGAVDLTIEPRGEVVEFYADDILYYYAETNDGYDGTINIATIPQSFEIDVLGETLDETDGVQTERANAEKKPFALLFEFDGDVKAVRHVLYSCKANRPSKSSSTKTNTKEPNTNELTFVSSPRETDLAVKTKTTETTSQAVYNDWYKAVYEKTEVQE